MVIRGHMENIAAENWNCGFPDLNRYPNQTLLNNHDWTSRDETALMFSDYIPWLYIPIWIPVGPGVIFLEHLRVLFSHILLSLTCLSCFAVVDESILTALLNTQTWQISISLQAGRLIDTKIQYWADPTDSHTK